MAGMNAYNHYRIIEDHITLYKDYKCTRVHKYIQVRHFFYNAINMASNQSSYRVLIELTSTRPFPTFADYLSTPGPRQKRVNTLETLYAYLWKTILYSILTQWLIVRQVLQPDSVHVLSCRLQPRGAANECWKSNGWTLIDSVYTGFMYSRQY